MKDITFIYITCPTSDHAKKIAKHLIELRMVACGNFFPVTSLYRWEGKIVDEEEVVLILKTSEKFYDSILKEVEKMHPYTIPCIAKISGNINEKYSTWLEGEIKK